VSEKVVCSRSSLLRNPERYGSYHDVCELLKLIRRQQDELWRQAQVLGQIIFLEKSLHVYSRLKHHWEEARREGELSTLPLFDEHETPPGAGNGSDAALSQDK